MHGDYGVDQVAPKRAEPSENSILVRAGKQGVADDIGHQDRSELPCFAYGAIAEAGRSPVAVGMVALPCCTRVENAEAGSAGPACRLAKPIHAVKNITRSPREE
jgi:hypothetical protein